MYKNTFLDKYYVEYFLSDEKIEVWRNGKRYFFNLDFGKSDFDELIIERLCIESPISFNEMKKSFSEKTEKPKVGEFIAVKKLNELIDFYKVYKFIRFDGDKIICESKSGNKELSFDFYQIFDGVNHPSTTFWFNSKGNSVPWLVLEKLFGPKFS